MKKVGYIALLLISTLGFSQDYQAKIKRFGGGVTQFAFSNGTSYKAYNNTTLVDSYDFSDDTSQSINPPSIIYLNSSLPITKIIISYDIDYDEGFPAVANCSVTKTVNISDVDCFSTFLSDCRSFSLEVYNTQVVQPANNTFCPDVLLPLSSNNACNTYVYEWYFTTNLANSFQSLGVQSTGSNTVNADLSAFLPNNYTGNVFIRALVNGHFTNSMIYTAIGCTPGINSVVTISTSCNNSSDGGFVITFEETLSNEQILFVLKRDNASGPIISSSTATISGTTYTWPNPLPQATYYLDYQSTPTGSVISYPNIVINAPTAVTFTANWADIDCFGANTGSISINASGGIGNYEYSINNGSNWAVFNNVSIHTITNLTTGSYQIKVRDANNCVSQL